MQRASRRARTLLTVIFAVCGAAATSAHLVLELLALTEFIVIASALLIVGLGLVVAARVSGSESHTLRRGPESACLVFPPVSSPSAKVPTRR